MSVHLIKLCVGADDIEDLVVWQKKVMARRKAAGLSPNPTHETRQMPKRADELIDGGSLYWVIRGLIQVRQRIVAINAHDDAYGKSYCELVLDPELHETDIVPKRPFQGWRYLKVSEAPADIGQSVSQSVPKPLVHALKDAGVW